MSNDHIGPVKIKDGLFIGDEVAAQDLEFLIANKVTHIVNCSARQVPNHWESMGVHYKGYPWSDSDSQVILDVRDTVISEVFTFIEECVDKGESVLMHSYRGQSRCVTLLAAYLIKRYRWSLGKTMEFVTSRRADIMIKPVFYRQLQGYEKRLITFLSNAEAAQTGKNVRDIVALSSGWQDNSSYDELMIRNTFLNGKTGYSTIKDLPFVPCVGSRAPAKCIRWPPQLTVEQEDTVKSQMCKSSTRPILKKRFVPVVRSEENSSCFNDRPVSAKPPRPPSASRPVSPAPRHSNLLSLRSNEVNHRPASPIIRISTMTSTLPPPSPTILPSSRLYPPPSPSRQLFMRGPVKAFSDADKFVSTLPAPSVIRARSPFSVRPPTPPARPVDLKQGPFAMYASSSPARIKTGVYARAPSPTPAFNRPLVVGNPRWRN